MHRNKHSALKTEIIGSASDKGVQFILVRLMWGKNDIAYSLHAAPNSFSTAGLQTTDFLSYLGFERDKCAFVTSKECYSQWVKNDFAIRDFSKAFAEAFSKIEKAERHLNACGFFLDQPEGWGYFSGKPSGTKRRRSYNSSSYGDGHIASKSELMKETEGESLQFLLSWITGDRDKGWTFHYRPKQHPISNGLQAVFQFLGLRTYEECPYFDFEKCYWRFIPHESRGDSFFESNAGAVHGWFDAHSNKFETGLKELLEAQDILQPFDMFFLPVIKDDIPTLSPASVRPTPSSFSTRTNISTPSTSKTDNSPATRPMIFVCYSHKDEKEKNELLSHLGEGWTSQDWLRIEKEEEAK